MRYVYNPMFQPRIPGSAVVRIVFGVICALFFFVVLGHEIELIRTNDEDASVWLIFVIGFCAGAFLLLFFGVRAFLSARHSVAIRKPGEPIVVDPKDPLFSVSCTVCATRFDYQTSDLGFRPWFPNGYVECPECTKPLRHNALENTYMG